MAVGGQAPPRQHVAPARQRGRPGLEHGRRPRRLREGEGERLSRLVGQPHHRYAHRRVERHGDDAGRGGEHRAVGRDGRRQLGMRGGRSRGQGGEDRERRPPAAGLAAMAQVRLPWFSGGNAPPPRPVPMPAAPC